MTDLLASGESRHRPPSAPIRSAGGGVSLWSRLHSFRSRFTFRFSGSGRYAAALTADGEARLRCELWMLPDETVPYRPTLALSHELATTDDVPVDAIPFDDGTLVLVRASGELCRLAPAGPERVLGRLPFTPRLIAAPPESGQRVVFLGRADDASGNCVAWMLPHAHAAPRPLADLPPLLLRGGGWADVAGTRLLVNLRDEGTVRPGVLDVVSGTCTALPPRDPAMSDTVWMTAPAAGAALLASVVDEVAVARIMTPQRETREITTLGEFPGDVKPVALSRGAELVAVQVRDGLRQRLAVVDLLRDTVLDTAQPGDEMLATAGWAGRPEDPVLWGLATRAGLPARVVAYHGRGRTEAGRGRTEADRGRTEADDGTPAGGYDGWAPSHLERFPGAVEPIEAVVCGHHDWRDASEVVIALHGGPAAHWPLKFSQFFQVLAAEGLTVLALNPRGSTGYGDAFHQHLVGQWGGPDLADVLAVTRYVVAGRSGRRALLFGESYGAFLALLSAGAAPDLWDRVLAVAPFLSGTGLYQVASPRVQNMIDRLGGRKPVLDEHGPRDVLELAGRITAPLLLIHGAADEIIPVGQSRTLAEHLTRIGRRPGMDFRYQEVAGAPHTPLAGAVRLQTAAATFLKDGTWPDGDAGLSWRPRPPILSGEEVST